MNIKEHAPSWKNQPIWTTWLRYYIPDGNEDKHVIDESGFTDQILQVIKKLKGGLANREYILSFSCFLKDMSFKQPEIYSLPENLQSNKVSNLVYLFDNSLKEDVE